MSILILDSTNKSIKAVLSAAPETTNPDFVVSYADTSASAFTEVANDGALNGTTEVTLVSAPDANVRRVVKDIRIHNRDTTAVTITLKYDNNGTQRTIAKALLAADETYTLEGVFDSEGDVRTDTPVEPQITGITGTLFSGTTSSLTIFGQNFGTLQGEVQFVYGPFNGNTTVTSVGVTPTSNNELTVNVPLQIYSLSGGVSGYIKFIRSDGAGSNQFTKAIAANEITSITQNSGLGLTLTGTSFGTLQGTVRFVSGGIQADVTATPSSPTSISVLIPQAINNIAAGTQITVQYIDGNSVASNQFGYTPTLMKITGFSQTDSINLTFTGTNFGTTAGILTITGGGVTENISVTPQGPTSIQVTVPQSIIDLAQGTSLNFTFEDTNGVDSNTFSAIPKFPRITNVANIFGFNNVGAIAHNATITGTDLEGLTGSLTFVYDGVTEVVTNVTASSATTITVAVPATIYNQLAGTSGTVTFTASGVSTNTFVKALETAPTGGTITTVGNYRIHAFNSSGTFIVPSGVTLDSVYVAIVAGGGSGAHGGGGAGGVLTQTLSNTSSGSYTINVGSGGPSGSSPSNGTNSTAFGYTAIGGGVGANGRSASGASGGSGGGTGYDGSNTSSGGGAGTTGQGFRGGHGSGGSSNAGASGGGGAGGVGGAGSPDGSGLASGTQGGKGGNGGPGIDLSGFIGTALGESGWFAGGGGGGGNVNNANVANPAPGGQGGGGDGSTTSSGTTQAGTAGAQNTGGGGGGGDPEVASTSFKGGGSGIVIIRYQV